MRFGWFVMAAVLLTGRVALAHEVACDKRVNGETFYAVQSFPATLVWTMTVRNVHPDSPSSVDGVEDRLLTGQFGWAPSRPPPYTLALGEAYTETFSTTVMSLEECELLAGAEPRIKAFDLQSGRGGSFAADLNELAWIRRAHAGFFFQLGRHDELIPKAELLSLAQDRTPAGRTQVFLEPCSAKPLLVRNARTMPLSLRYTAMWNRELHTGDILGWPTRILAALFSLSLPLMGLTGPLIWWTRRRKAGSTAPVPVAVPESS